jgi:hypothetical protein
MLRSLPSADLVGSRYTIVSPKDNMLRIYLDRTGSLLNITVARSDLYPPDDPVLVVFEKEVELFVPLFKNAIATVESSATAEKALPAPNHPPSGAASSASQAAASAQERPLSSPNRPDPALVGLVWIYYDDNGTELRMRGNAVAEHDLD